MNQQEIVRSVNWQDLKKLSVKEMLIENNISLPWLFISLGLAWQKYYICALLFSAFDDHQQRCAMLTLDCHANIL